MDYNIHLNTSPINGFNEIFISGENNINYNELMIYADYYSYSKEPSFKDMVINKLDMECSLTYLNHVKTFLVNNFNFIFKDVANYKTIDSFSLHNNFVVGTKQHKIMASFLDILTESLNYADDIHRSQTEEDDIFEVYEKLREGSSNSMYRTTATIIYFIVSANVKGKIIQLSQTSTYIERNNLFLYSGSSPISIPKRRLNES